MKIGNFYFLKDEYFLDFPDENLMKNKESVGNGTKDRPCFYVFKDVGNNIYWMIPFTSKVEKFKKIYNKAMSKSGICDTIVFGKVLGHEKAFLIQNMCPVSEKYIKNKYIDKSNNLDVVLSKPLQIEIIKKASKVLALYRKGIKLIYPNVKLIEEKLKKQLTK